MFSKGNRIGPFLINALSKNELVDVAGFVLDLDRDSCTPVF